MNRAVALSPPVLANSAVGANGRKRIQTDGYLTASSSVSQRDFPHKKFAASLRKKVADYAGG